MAGPGARPIGLPAGLVWPVRVDDTGQSGPTRMQARGQAWRRTSRGHYVPSSASMSVEQRIVSAAAVLPAYGAVTGWAGLRWLGGSWFDGDDPSGAELPVTLALMDSSIRAQAGIAISEERLDPAHILAHAGIRVTAPTYALLWEIRHARSDLAALIAADMAAYDDLVSRRELAALVAACPGWDGIGRGRTTVDNMEENAWSPAEVAMRSVWAEAVRARPVANQPVFDLSGRHIGTPDLLDVSAGVAGEYDSALHLERARRRKDVERDERFRGVGLEPVIMVTGDLAAPSSFIARLRTAYQRAARRPATDRRWTTDQPTWWMPTQSVEQRRALTDAERVTWLRYRRLAG